MRCAPRSSARVRVVAQLDVEDDVGHGSERLREVAHHVALTAERYHARFDDLVQRVQEDDRRRAPVTCGAHTPGAGGRRAAA